MIKALIQNSGYLPQSSLRAAIREKCSNQEFGIVPAVRCQFNERRLLARHTRNLALQCEYRGGCQALILYMGARCGPSHGHTLRLETETANHDHS